LGVKKDSRRRREQYTIDAVTRLCWAASQGDVRGIELLIARGAKLDLADYDGRTALHLAASEGKKRAVAALLARGVSATAKDRWGNTALDDALRGGHTEVVTMLKAAVGATRAAEAPIAATPRTLRS
jgi:glutaminase